MTKRKSESQTGFEPMTSQSPGGRSIHLSYRELMESEAIHILGSYLTRALHIARISNVNVVLCDERMKDGKFWARWNRCENKKKISMSLAWDKEKIWVPDRIRTYDLRRQLETVLDIWLVNVCIKEYGLFKAGHTFGVLAVSLVFRFSQVLEANLPSI